MLRERERGSLCRTACACPRERGHPSGEEVVVVVVVRREAARRSGNTDFAERWRLREREREKGPGGRGSVESEV